MRKVFWCCLAAGAVCCTFMAAAYIWQNPESALGRFALAATHSDGAVSAGRQGTADAADLIPPDPAPVEEPSDLPPAPLGSEARLPQAVAALIPPIIIHDEEDLGATAVPFVPHEPPAAANVDAPAERPSTYDIEEIAHRLDADVAVEPKAGSPRMPYCTDDADPLPAMPGCIDDGTVPTMPPAPPGDDGASSREMRRPDAWAWWLGFFSGPSQLTADPSAGRCEEDAHYGQQYPGAPYTEGPGSADQPARSDVKAPAFPGADENSEPPSPRAIQRLEPHALLSQPRRLQTPRPTEPQSDTMEMRPSDWKPYSLEPGPF